MTIKDIFNSAINFDLTNIVYFVGGIILLVMPIGMVWFGDDIFLKNDSNLFEFAVCAIGLGSIVLLVLVTIYKILTGQKF